MLILDGLVKALEGISTVVGCPAILRKSGISIPGGTDATDVRGDFLEDSLDAGGSADEPFAGEIDQETVCTKEIRAQNRFLDVCDLEFPNVWGVVDLESHLTGTKRLDPGTVCCDEVQAGWPEQVWMSGRYDADLRSRVDEEIGARESVPDMKKGYLVGGREAVECDYPRPGWEFPGAFEVVLSGVVGSLGVVAGQEHGGRHA